MSLLKLLRPDPIAPDLAELYRQHRTYFLELERRDYGPKFERHTLEHRLTTSAGVKYYGFPSTVDLPLERYARSREFLAWLTAGYSADELKQLVEAADAALTAGIKTGKNAARIGLVLEELRDRTEKVLHHELIIHFLACQLVREDERPEVFDQVLHREKFTELLAESEAGNAFFFSKQLPELRKLQETTSYSAEEWTRYWHASRTSLQRLDAVLRIASSRSASTSSAKTSTAPA